LSGKRHEVRGKVREWDKEFHKVRRGSTKKKLRGKGLKVTQGKRG
jgi:hypothetical protein